MKQIILYDSATGNTEYLAKALSHALPNVPCGPVGSLDCSKAELVYLGFWTDKGTCSDRLRAVLPSLAGKQIFLFGTAGFGADQAYYDRIIQAAACELPESVKLKASFMCQGKMQQGVLERYRSMLEANPQDGRAKLMVDNYHAALTHPDGTDMAAFQHFLISSVPAAGMGE